MHELQANSALGQSHLQNGFPAHAQGLGGTAMPRGPLSVEMRNRFETLATLLGETNGQLSVLRERLFGPWPEPPAGSNGASAAKNALSDDILEFLDGLIVRAARVREHAETLNSAI